MTRIEVLGILLVLRAFASGSVALTGVEAIANGVPAFKPPESRNAARTLAVMAILLGVLFVGLTVVADGFGIVPIDEPGGQNGHQPGGGTIYGNNTIAFYLYQAFTAMILFLAANTSFNAFPRLAAILARDGYMPRQFSFRGDRLAFTSGIVILSIAAIAVIAAFGGVVTALIPLYAVGVFAAFTIGQVGMVRHWLSERTPGWRRKVSINAFGAGSDLPGFPGRPRGQGPDVAADRRRGAADDPGDGLHPPAVPSVGRSSRRSRGRCHPTAASRGARHRAIPGINRAVIQAVNVGRSIAPDVRAVLISDEPEEAVSYGHAGRDSSPTCRW